MNMNRTTNIIFSFFSGSGFLDLGFEQNGFNIDLVNEFQPNFIEAYKYARKGMGLREPEYGYFNIDINDFLGSRKEELGEHMLQARRKDARVGFIGGPPCPDFSVAGKNKGKNGDNGKLSQSYVDLICCMEPDFFLFENVKGLWKTARHRAFFEELKSQLHDAGYDTTQRLVNALDYGAPQDRDRILMFGIRKELEGSSILEDVFPWEKYMSGSSTEIKALPWPTTNDFIENSVTVCPRGIPEEQTVEYWFRKNDVDNHPNASDYFTPKAGLKKMLTIQEGDVSKKSYKRLHRWRYSPTAAYGNNEVHLHPYKARRISVAEALAIQTLPKEFCLPPDMTLTDKFKTTGNGVPYILSSGIAKTIRLYLDSLN